VDARHLTIVRMANQTATESLAGRRHLVFAAVAIAGIALHLLLRYSPRPPQSSWVGLDPATLPLLLTLLLAGLPKVFELLLKFFRREFGSDLLAGISIVSAALLGEYLAGALVVLMLSGGQTLDAFAVRRASSVLNTLAGRMPSVAHRKIDGSIANDRELADAQDLVE